MSLLEIRDLRTHFAVDGGEFRAPMAIGVIGGLLVSTALSLVFVPSFYTVMDDVSRAATWLFGRLLTPRDAPIPAPKRGAQAAPPAGLHQPAE